MKLFRLTAAIGLGLSFIGSAAIASTIGSLNSTRTYGAYQLDGGNYDDIRNAILGDGHTVVAGTSAVNGGYLSGLDVFYTGMIDTAAGVSEILALQSFVSAGGTLVIGADNTAVTSLANYNSWFNPFGLSASGNSSNGGVWATGADPLLANGVGGTALGTNAGTDFTPGGYNILATDSQGDAVVVSLAYGSGLVIGLGDGNFIDDPASLQSRQFFQNIMANAGIAPVPLPASFPLLLFGLGSFLAMAFRRRRES